MGCVRARRFCYIYNLHTEQHLPFCFNVFRRLMQQTNCAPFITRLLYILHTANSTDICDTDYSRCRKSCREGVDWIDLAQDSDRSRDFVNAVMNLRAPLNGASFFTR
jgi:hypothetical protein